KTEPGATWEIEKPSVLPLTKWGNARICEKNWEGFCIVCATSARLTSNFPGPSFLRSSLLLLASLLSLSSLAAGRPIPCGLRRMAAGRALNRGDLIAPFKAEGGASGMSEAG